VSVPVRRDLLEILLWRLSGFWEGEAHGSSGLTFFMAFPFRSVKGIHDASIWFAYGHVESAQFR
jgi:hypothetical protein